MRILQVGTFDIIGGAERVAWNLSQAYRARGHDSWLAVGHKLGNDPNVLPVSTQEPCGGLSGPWRHWCSGLRAVALRDLGRSRAGRLARMLAEPGKTLDQYRGFEDFRFPGTWKILELAGQRPDILHCHNLHGGYFDLRALPWLSRQLPVVLTLHDAWLLSGHCAHSLDCYRWRTGCGYCPDLTLDPPIRKDASARNWRRKRGIFENSQLYIATPSRWLMQRVEESMLAAAVVESRVIHNGVDLSVFHPVPRRAAREALGIPQNTAVVLFTAYATRHNPWKDYRTVRTAVALLAERLQDRGVLFIALGEDAPAERIGQIEVWSVPYQETPGAVASYYQAADVYVHASRADTFPNTVLEAMACGTPVVATAVGGIPEQVEEARTGFLVPPGDSQAIATALATILSDYALQSRLGMWAADVARRRFDLLRQADTYLDWYYALARNEGSASVSGEA